MLLLIIGTVFILLGNCIALENPDIVIEILPSFVGFALVAVGMLRLSANDEFTDAHRNIVPSVIASALSAVVFAFGIGGRLNSFLYSLAAITLLYAAKLYITYLITDMITKSEKINNIYYESYVLQKYWKLYLAAAIGSYLVYLFPAMGYTSIVLSLIVAILFVRALAKTARLTKKKLPL